MPLRRGIDDEAQTAEQNDDVEGHVAKCKIDGVEATELHGAQAEASPANEVEGHAFESGR